MSKDSKPSSGLPDSKKRRRTKGNVIYANFRGSRNMNNAKNFLAGMAAAKAASPVDELHQPLAKFVMEAVELEADPGRFVRGMVYSRTGHVLPSLRFDNSTVHAFVTGSQNEPFETTIIFPRRSPDEIAHLIEILAARPMLLHEGTIDGEILGIVAAYETYDMRYSCTCPDFFNACKHVVAVAHQLALILDEDPTKIFEIRGIDLTELERAVSSSVAQLSKRRAVESSERFWEGGPLPDLPTPRMALAIQDGDDTYLHQAFREISYSTIDEMRAVSDLEDLYYALGDSGDDTQ